MCEDDGVIPRFRSVVNQKIFQTDENAHKYFTDILFYFVCPLTSSSSSSSSLLPLFFFLFFFAFYDKRDSLYNGTQHGSCNNVLQ